jgi:predicted Zn-ribbon and HTH transcriptional regulator
MTTPQLILTYLTTVLTGLTAVVSYSEFRQQRFKPTPSNDRIFRCGRCGYVYTDDPDVDRSRCSQCGQMNEPIEF